MPQLTVDGYGTYEVSEGKRLVRALEDSGVDILHRCGGYANCTTCRVEFIDGEPEKRTVAEFNRLEKDDKVGEFRLSCQCLVEGDMHVRPLKTVSNSNHDDPGSTPEEHITPEPEWIHLEVKL